MNVIIFTSGKGERMLPFTKEKNKTTFNIKNKPLLEYHIENLLYTGCIEKIVVTTYHQRDSVLKVLDKVRGDFRLQGNGTYPESRREESRKQQGSIIEYEEDGLYGSATAVKRIMEEHKMDRAVVINGDTWYDSYFYLTLPVFYNKAKDDKKSNYLFVSLDKTYETGLVRFDNKSNEILEVAEDGNFCNKCKSDKIGKYLGIAIVNSDIVTDGDFMTDFVTLQFNKFSVIPVIETARWLDIGTPKAYIELTAKNYNSFHVQNLFKIARDSSIDIIERIIFAERIFICGNGGSLSTSQHLALDFAKCGKKQAISLGCPSTISAIGNDDGFENVFLNQLSNYNIGEKDVILLLSGSGNSPNIVKVAEEYPENVVGMTGNKGWLYEHVQIMPVESDSIRIIEDAHLSYGHLITEILDGLTDK